MLVKFELIYKELLINENVVYVDGDIVFKRLCNKLIDFSPSSDIVFQNDLRPSKPNREWVWVLCIFNLMKSLETFLNRLKNLLGSLQDTKHMINPI